MAADILSELTEDERQLVESAKHFARREVEPVLAQAERTGRFPSDLYQGAAQARLNAIQVPVSDGGLGFSYRCKMAVAEAISQTSMAFAFSLVNTHNTIAKLAIDAPQIAASYVPQMLGAKRFGATALTEPHAGSDFSAIKTTATRVEGGWTITGEKTWITNAGFADIFVTYAQTDASKGWRGIACFLVDATEDGCEISPTIDVFGGQSIATGGFNLNDHFVPDDRVIHPPGEAFKAALGSINGARTYVAAMCCGMVMDAFETTKSYLRERHAFGDALLKQQGLRWRLADIATDLEAARFLTYEAARLVDVGAKDAVLAAAMAKKFAPAMAEKRLLECIQALGANGLRTEHRLGHHLACAKISGYVDGSTEIQTERIATLLLDS
ncbi:MAG: acyl-CoA dehydrogenase family protein [Gammaproteobacteria bacterium]